VCIKNKKKVPLAQMIPALAAIEKIAVQSAKAGLRAAAMYACQQLSS
jgi:hypothetical protein